MNIGKVEGCLRFESKSKFQFKSTGLYKKQNTKPKQGYTKAYKKS